MKHKNKVKKLATRIKNYEDGPKDQKDRYRWETLKNQGGVHRPGSINK